MNVFDETIVDDDAILVVPPSMDQSSFLWRNNDGDEMDATALAVEGGNITHRKNETVRLRVQVNATGDVDEGQFQLEYRKVSDGPSGAWTKVKLP